MSIMADTSKQHFMDGLLELLQRVDLHVDFLCEERMTTMANVLQKLSETVKQCEYRSKLEATTLDKLSSILRDCVTPVEDSSVPVINNKSVQIVCSWCLRCLRNSCVESPSNQHLIWDTGAVGSLKQLIHLISAAPSPQQEELTVCLRCAVQLLGNLISCQEDLQAHMWKEVFPHTLLSVFQCADSKSSQYLCMVINMCVQASPSVTCAHQLWTCEDGYQLVEAVLALCETESEHDFSLQLLQTLIGIPDFIPAVFNHLTSSSQIILLDILAAFLSQSDDALDPLPKESVDGEGSPSLPSVEFLAEVFEEEAGCVFGLVSEEQWSDIEKQKKPQLVMRLLNTLCVATTHPQANRKLQPRVCLLECSLDLLDRANNAGKKSKNHFTSTQTLEDADAQTNPVFGFKRDLVRLIGNMCHNHTANQDKVRQLHGIPVILEQCNIDDSNPCILVQYQDLKSLTILGSQVRQLHGIPVILEQCNIDDSNPFISQWAIFAIRNLCNGNPQNQAVITEMTNQGVVNNDQLQQYGFQAECREGTMYYRSTRKK